MQSTSINRPRRTIPGDDRFLPGDHSLWFVPSRARGTMDAMPTRLSARVSAISESATLAVDAKAKALKAAGRPVIGFGAGEPDFPTPAYIVEAAQRACEQPRFHKYTPAAGLPELREAIAAKTARDSGYQVEPSQVLVTNGGKQAVYQAFAALLDPGDEVIVPAPYWTTYPESIALAGGVMRPVMTDEDSGYLASVADLEAARTDRTKIVLVVSPSNPTGAVYPPDQIAAIGEWAADNGLWVITDEIYEHLVYGDAVFSSVPVQAPRVADTCVVLNGVAKTYAMTGWRVGWMIGPEGHHQRRGEHAEPRDLQRVQRGPGGRAGRRVGRPVGGRGDARGVRPAPADHDPDAERDPGRDLPGAAGRVLLLPQRQGPAGPGNRRPPGADVGGTGRPGPGRGRSSRGPW